MYRLLALLLTACTTQPPTMLITQREQVAQQSIMWIVTDIPTNYCGKLKYNGCVLLHSDVCTIVAPMPKSFLDHWALEVAGHELWHCFHGAVHD